MSKTTDINKPESCNWLKQWRAVFITRQALLLIVSDVADQLHGDLVQKVPVPACVTCSSKDVLKKNASCRYHNDFRDELVKEHAYGQARGIGALTLKNTKAENWAHSAWELVKVFMPPAGYENKTTIEETDFNGIAGFIINCKRFQGKITGSICEKAREVVNHIRHMPDSSSSALTDQATTECIDNLYALLNETGLKTQPEAIQARKQLDELKTADPSKDEDTRKYICKEIHDGFGQKLVDIEMKLQTKEIDVKSSKEDLHSYSQDVLEAVKLVSDDTMHDLSKTKDDILLSIKEKTRRVLDHIAFQERKATEHIEQSTKDGQRILLQTATECKRTLEDHTEKFAERLRKEGDENLQKKKLELKEQLIKHYKITASRIPVRLKIDETIEKIYENPKLTEKKTTNGKPTEKDITEIDHLFSTSDVPIAEKIIVEGKPGTGKTSLCKKIVHEWLKVNENVEQEPIPSNLSKFELVFLIILRHFKTKSKVKEMIVDHILKNIDSTYENAHSLVGGILKSEHCLLLLDGLDEWRGEMPYVETSWSNCTTLFTTRPYKLAELKVIPTQVGKHVILGGVQNPGKLVLRVIQKLEEFIKTNKDPESCIQELKHKQLWHFSENPVVLVHIIWLWKKNKIGKGKALSTLYQEIIDERLYDLCDKTKQVIDQQELFEVLSEIAFNKLLSENRDESLVFNIKGIELEKFNKYKKASLESGIMSSSDEPDERLPQYQFLQKTFQEYLAAYFLSSKRGPALSTYCERVKTIYSNHRIESVFALEQVFLFLCGLNPVAAKEFSKTLNELFTEEIERDTVPYMHLDQVHRFQDMILKGYDEAERNSHTGEEFCLQHIELNSFESQFSTHNHRTKLKMYWKKRKSNLVSVRIYDRISRPYIDIPTILDLQNCKNLKFVHLRRVRFDDINQLNLNGLLHCIITFNDYTPARRLMSSLRSHDLRGLKTLTLENVGFECEAINIFSKLKCVKELDLVWSKSSLQTDSLFDFEHLTHLEYLIKLTLRELPFFDVGNLQLRNLQQLTIGFRTQQQAPQLIAALLQEGCDSLTTVPNCPHFILKDLTLENVRMSAEVYRRLVSVVVQPGHSVDLTLNSCTIECDITQVQKEMANQPALQLIAPQAVSSDYTTSISLLYMTLSAEVFWHLVSVVVLSGHNVDFTLITCTIEKDKKQVKEEMGNQPALQMIAPQAVSSDYITRIALWHMTLSAEVFLHLVSVVLQSGHSEVFELGWVSIEGDITQVQKEMGNQPALQMIAPQAVPSEYKTNIRLLYMTLSADLFRRLLSVAIQSGQIVKCQFECCAIEPDEEVSQLQHEMGNQPAIHVIGFSRGEEGWNIECKNNI